ncbi:MAG: prolipoprotein diacylglyceryl transferase [bacterium]|nr:prolipoprotein diacylglyceryl transferase [bacterium]
MGLYPEIFGLIKSYGLMLALSFGLGLALSLRRGRRHQVQPDDITDLVFTVLVASLVGVRAFYVATHGAEFSAGGAFDPWYRALFIWDGGLTLYGGILLSIVAVWWQARRRGIPFLVMADIFSPGVILGIGITRIGCFLAGCCYGLPSDIGCAVHFPVGSPSWRQFGDVAVHPSQLYGSFGGFAIFGLLLLLERLPSPRGATFGRFLALYGVSRFLVDLSRWYEPDQVMALGWSNNQWISAGLVAAGIVILALAHGRRWEATS